MTKYLLYNSRLVKPEMEKPKFNYDFPPDGPSTSMLESAQMDYEHNWGLYNHHLSTLPGIKCSDKLLAKFKDGQELEEGKDFEIDQKWVGPFVDIEYVAVPVQSDEEERMSFDELKYAILKAPKIKSEYRQAAIVIIRDIFQQYKLTKK